MENAAPELPRLLIVDDSRMVRASIIKHLKGRYAYREEVNGEAAWQTLVLDPTIRAVISDLGMPVLDGFGHHLFVGRPSQSAGNNRNLSVGIYFI